MVTSFWRDEDAMIHVEHAILLAVLVVAALATWTLFGGRLRDTIGRSSDSFATAAGGSPRDGTPPLGVY